MPVGALAILVLTSVVISGNLINALRSGAPSLACTSMRPFHGLHQPRPASASQFFVTQSALTYAPGDNVTVEITTHSNERHFRGFMVQAYDPVNGQRIGAFVASDIAQPMSSCSAATHRNHSDKRSVSITWVESESAAEAVAAAQEAAAAAAAAAAATTPESAEMLASEQQQQVSQTVNRIGSWLGLPPINGSATGGEMGKEQKQIEKRLWRKSPTPATATESAGPVKQVRFRATIVVSYDEFYTGFESSELNFAKWDYSKSTGTGSGTS